MDGPENRLALIELLDRDGRPRRVVDVFRWPVTLGRGLHNSIVLDDPHVAAHHATLAPDAQGALWLQVGDSVNGVALGAAKRPPVLPAGARAQLPAPGAVMQLGGQRLRLRLPAEVLGAEQLFTRPAVAGRALAAVALAWVLLETFDRWAAVKVTERVLRDLYASETGVLPTQDNQPLTDLPATARRELKLANCAPPRLI